jgi:hypothetical protein
MSHLRIEQTGPADCRVWAGTTLLAEIRSLRLAFLRLREDGVSVLGPDVPLPLFWEQYADHEDPDRNSSSRAVLTVAGAPPYADGKAADPTGEMVRDAVSVLCRGSNASASVQSMFRLTFERTAGSAEYGLLVEARLEVVGESGWLVTPNPHHGELEFCNFWAAGSFSVAAGSEKRYSMTAVRRGEEVTLLPHNHLESAEKHNVLVHKGDRLAWLLEDENPVLTIESEPPVSAGLCAYMWDLHVAYKLCETGMARLLPKGFTVDARYRVSVMGRADGQAWLDRGKRVVSSEDDCWPVYVQGVNSFQHTVATAPGDPRMVWPWTFEVVDGIPGTIQGDLDRSTGFDDHASVRICSTSSATGRWLATTLGPAFGGGPFHAAKRYRLTARVRTEELDGKATIALRLHRTGQPDLHHAGRYEEFRSPAAAAGTTGWQELAVVSPRIVPEPDRVHLLLLHEGKGTSWFDNVSLEEME